MRQYIILALVPAFSCTGCGDEPPPVPQTEQSAQGREETKDIRATHVLGYDGAAIGNKVDQVLDANDARKDQLDKAIDAQ